MRRQDPRREYDSCKTMAEDFDGAMYRFCPCCGGGLEARVIKAGDRERLVCRACGFVFYIDPKVAVGTIIRTADHGIVLCRRAIQPGYGRWVFPGGYVDRGEVLEEAAQREAREECGLEVELEGIVSLHSSRGHTPVVIVFAARVTGGELKVADDESLEVRAFASDTIPWGDLAFDTTREALTAYFSRHWPDTGVSPRSPAGDLNPQ
jgi:8-oxo-dGTP diphosphatase